jgi:large subunit ribosomal protein L18
MKKTRKVLHKKVRRAHRVRAMIGKGISEKPRLSVFRSNVHIYAQLIDDASGKTVISASSHEIKTPKLTKTMMAKEVGKLTAEKAKKVGITKAIFDRGSYRYHGRVKTLAEAAREAGLKF